MAKLRSCAPFRNAWPAFPLQGQPIVAGLSGRNQCRLLRHLMAPPELLEIAKHRCFKGTLYRFEHISPVLGDCTMKLSTFVPSGKGKFPGVIWLSGLTCTDESLAQRASSALEFAQELQLILIMPDTSPRGEGVPDEDPKAFDVGIGASFYVNATTEKYKKHYQMLDYITQELPSMVAAKLPLLQSRLGIMGHSMGGHGALVAALRYPELYRSVSAFAPIVHPTESPWGQKAFSLYLGEDHKAWAAYDTLELLKRYKGPPKRLLVDQGLADPFLSEQLKPGLLKALCDEKGLALTLRNQQDYDHSYYFISSFIQDHLKYHASFLTGVLKWCPDPEHPLAASVYSVDPALDESLEDETLEEVKDEVDTSAEKVAEQPSEEPAPDEVEKAASKAGNPESSHLEVLDGECLAAVCFEEPSLKLVKIQVSPPGPGEVRLRIVAAAPSLQKTHSQERSFPRILGVEAAAVVEDVGEGVEEFQPGDHVIPCFYANCGRCSRIPTCKMTSCSSQDNFCESIQRFASRGLMRDETTRFSYGSTEIFHFQGCSAFSEYTVVHAQSLVKIRKDLHQPPLFLQCFMLKLSGLSQDAPLEVACLLGGGVAAALGMVWRVAALPYGCPVGAVFGLQAEGLAALRALQMAKAGRRAEAPADVAFDTLGYEATLQQALAPWAPSYALVSSASSAVHVTGGLAGRGIPFGGWRPKLHVPLLVDLFMAGELKLRDFISHTASFAEINEVLDSYHEPDRIRTVLRF
eukprot:g16445.t1